VQRIVVQLVAAAEQLVQRRPVLFEVTQQKPLRELPLVLEMVEEAALGDPHRRDQLLDRGARKALGEYRLLGHFEQPLTRLAASAHRHVEHRTAP
jgi:hypothetical protein